MKSAEPVRRTGWYGLLSIHWEQSLAATTVAAAPAVEGGRYVIQIHAAGVVGFFFRRACPWPGPRSLLAPAVEGGRYVIQIHAAGVVGFVFRRLCGLWRRQW